MFLHFLLYHFLLILLVVIIEKLYRRLHKISFKPKDDLKSLVSEKAIQQIETRKANLSTKFSSSKLLKDNDFAFSQKNLGKFEGIEEVPESSYNSSLNSNAFNWKNKKFNSRQSINKKDGYEHQEAEFIGEGALTAVYKTMQAESSSPMVF